MYELERDFGPDPLNPCADLAGIAARVYDRILALRKEADTLEVMCENIFLGMDRLIELERRSSKEPNG
jgi:hypothetical protein